MIALFRNRTGSGGLSVLSAYFHASSVNRGRDDRRASTESGSVLNDVRTDQPNGMNIRIA